MYNSILSLTALALAAVSTVTAADVGQARVVNNCDFGVSLWAVGTNIDGPYKLGPHGGSYAETFAHDDKTGGRALKITIPDDGLWTGAPQTDFAYNLAGDKVFYDLSDVFGDPFAGHKLLVKSDQDGCGVIEWDNGTPPAGSQVKDCTSSKSVTFTICAA